MDFGYGYLLSTLCISLNIFLGSSSGFSQMELVRACVGSFET